LFFKTKSFAVKFIEAFGYSDGAGGSVVRGRSYNALSYRLEAVDTSFSWEGGHARVEAGDICFAPSRLAFTRTTQHDVVLVVHFELYGADYADIETFSPVDPEAYRTLFEELLETYEKNAPDRDCACSALLYRILGLICTEKDEEVEESRDRTRIRAACERIDAHYCDPDLSISSLARLCGMSEVYFRKTFEREFGMSPKKYITSLRIKKALSMLETNYFTLAEVAERTGFCDAKYFSTVFHRVTGKTPAKYVADKCAMKSRWDVQ